MKPHPRFFILVFISFAMSLASCVSVNFAPETRKSKGLEFTPPASPFKEISVKSADQAWKSTETGNTISFFSECAENSLPLEKFREDVMNSLSKPEVLNSTPVEHDGREGLQSLVEGKLEGIPMRVSMLAYQKNGCRYSLSLTGRKDRFDRDLEAFANFQKGFKAP